MAAPYRMVQTERVVRVLKGASSYRLAGVLRFSSARSTTDVFGFRQPTAIPRLIVTVRVLAVYLMRRRWWHAHVSEEVIEILPAYAYRDPFPAIVFVRLAGGVFASTFHTAPPFIHRGVRFSVGYQSVVVVQVAPARLGAGFACKRPDRNLFEAAAVTFA